MRFYPEPDPVLLSALDKGDVPGILAGLQRTFAPVRPEYALWERTGHVRLRGETTGFVREVGSGVEPQPQGRFDLSCAGGFLEAVRLLLLPHIEMDELGQCDAELLASIDGAPEVCDRRGDFGWLALSNIAIRLDQDQLPLGRMVWTRPVLRRNDIKADVPAGQIRLCTVSHASGVHAGERFHHHMMIMLEPDDAGEVPLFDTTGSRGVYLRSRPYNLVSRYAKHLLADNDAYDYDPESTRLTCLDVRL